MTEEYTKTKKTGRHSKKKIRGIFVISLIVFMALVGRIIYLMNTKGEIYAQRVLSQQAYMSKNIPYQRGTIYDRNGIVLAVSEKFYRVVVDAKVIMNLKDKEQKNNILKTISETFEVDLNELTALLETKSTSSYVILKASESGDKVTKYRELSAEDDDLIGVYFEVEYNRRYPYDTLASHVIGYTNPGNVGAYGIEQYYNDELNGVDGKEYGYYNSDLNSIKSVKEPENGNNIVSTIDVRIQSVVERYAREFNENIGADNMGIVVMNPNNGEILAMTSNDEFNLNAPRDLSYYLSEDEISALGGNSEAELEACYSMWRNFCVNDTYEPGSTFKTITVASALEEAAVKHNDTFYCGGSMTIGGWKISCNNRSGHGDLSLAEGLMKSCNCVLMSVADKLGSPEFLKYQKNFGFGSPTGLDMPGETGGILIKPENLNVTELATSSFGLRFNISMIQMISAFSSIINGGNYYIPHMAKQILSPEGNVIENIDVKPARKTVSAETTDFIRQSLYRTVMEGTGTAAQVDGYLIGGKTGTAQKLPRDSKKYVVSFIGFAPVNDPQVVIYVVLDEIHDEEKKDKSSVASGMTGNIFREILPELGIYPEGEIVYNTDLLELLQNSETYDPLQDEGNIDVTNYPDGTDIDNEDNPETGEETENINNGDTGE